VSITIENALSEKSSDGMHEICAENRWLRFAVGRSKLGQIDKTSKGYVQSICSKSP